MTAYLVDWYWGDGRMQKFFIIALVISVENGRMFGEHDLASVHWEYTVVQRDHGRRVEFDNENWTEAMLPNVVWNELYVSSILIITIWNTSCMRYNELEVLCGIRFSLRRLGWKTIRAFDRKNKLTIEISTLWNVEKDSSHNKYCDIWL